MGIEKLKKQIMAEAEAAVKGRKEKKELRILLNVLAFTLIPDILFIIITGIFALISESQLMLIFVGSTVFFIIMLLIACGVPYGKILPEDIDKEYADLIMQKKKDLPLKLEEHKKNVIIAEEEVSDLAEEIKLIEML